MFLELVRQVAERDPTLAQHALTGLAAYERAERPAATARRAEVANVGPASLRDHGGSGPAAVLVPSLINPPDVLDLDQEVSLAASVAGMGRRALLLDWGPASERRELSVAGHVEALLLPLLGTLAEPPALIGYCLGGTMAIAAANLTKVERVATLASPWHFARYPEQSRQSLSRIWKQSQPLAEALGALPMEVLQAAFWSLDPKRTVAKFAAFAGAKPNSRSAQRFIALEDWANEGEPLPLPAARELIEDMFGADFPGKGRWRVGGRTITDALQVPTAHFTAGADRIAPADTAPKGQTVKIAAGHVGMVVGSARTGLHDGLARFLDPACR